MKSKFLFLIIFFLIITGLALYGYLKSTAGIEDQAGDDYPQIEITPSTFDFGEVEYGEIARYTFQVRNSGSQTLEIRRVATSCSCTKAKVKKEAINSGEEVALEVDYDTGAMSGSHAKGRQERIIYIKSNDPTSPQVEVTITAYVK